MTEKKYLSILAGACGVLALLCVIAFFGQYGFAVLIAVCGLCILLFKWKSLGIISGFIVPAVILSYYCVIGGWTLIYIVKAVTGGLTFTTQAGAEAVMKPILEAPKSAWGMIISAHLVFIAITGSILLFGVKKGIERFSKFLMPFLFVLLVILLLRSITLPNASKGIRFFLYPDFSKHSAEGVMIAMGHAFFTLSLAMGITITYGSYLKKQTNLIFSIT